MFCDWSWFLVSHPWTRLDMMLLFCTMMYSSTTLHGIARQLPQPIESIQLGYDLFLLLVWVSGLIHESHHLEYCCFTQWWILSSSCSGLPTNFLNLYFIPDSIIGMDFQTLIPEPNPLWVIAARSVLWRPCLWLHINLNLHSVVDSVVYTLIPELKQLESCSLTQ